MRSKIGLGRCVCTRILSNCQPLYEMTRNAKYKVVAVQQHKASRVAYSLAHAATAAMASRALRQSASKFRISSSLTQQISKRALIQEFDKSNKMLWSRALTMTHRLAIFVGAVVFLNVCISACIDIFHELNADQGASMDISPTESLLINQWVGTTTIRASPLIMDLLGNDTSPRTGTLYLDTESTSFSGCTSVKLSDEIYLDNYQRLMFNIRP